METTMDTPVEVGAPTKVPDTPEEEREAIRMRFMNLLEDTKFPQAIAQSLVGCSRTTLHNWINGKEISNAYIPIVLDVISVLEMCMALKVFPLENCKQRYVHGTFYNAIATLRASMLANRK